MVMMMSEIVMMTTVAGGQKYTESSFTIHWFAFVRHSAVFSDLDDIFCILIVVHVMGKGEMWPTSQQSMIVDANATDDLKDIDLCFLQEYWVKHVQTHRSGQTLVCASSAWMEVNLN